MSALAEAPESEPAVVETAPTPETPASPEPVASEESTASSAVSAPATESVKTRGPDGRFIKADGTQVSDAEQAVLEQTPPAVPTPASPATTAPPTPLAATEPFLVRADGKRVPIPGAHVNAEGQLTIPPEQVSVVRQLMSDGLLHRGSGRHERDALHRQIAESTTVADAKIRKYNDAAMFCFERLEELLGPDDPRMQSIRDRLDIQLQRADLAIPRETARPEPVATGADDGQADATLAAARSALEEELDVLLDRQDARTVYADPKERESVLARHQRRLNSYFVEQSDGSIALDRHALRDDFNDDIAVRQQMQKTVEDARKATTFNAQRATPVTAPPIVQTRGPAASGTPAKTTYDHTNKEKGRAEWRRDMGLP